MAKTIKEAAQECEFHSIGNKSHFTTQKIFKYGVAFAQNWIPIEEELPPDFTTVLVKKDSEAPIRSTALYKDKTFYPDFFAIEHSDVTHWRFIDLK